MIQAEDDQRGDAGKDRERRQLVARNGSGEQDDHDDHQAGSLEGSLLWPQGIQRQGLDGPGRCRRAGPPPGRSEPDDGPVGAEPTYQDSEDEEVEEVAERLWGQVILVDPIGDVEEPDSQPNQPPVGGHPPEEQEQGSEVEQVEEDRRPGGHRRDAAQTGRTGEEGGQREEAGPVEVGIDRRVDRAGPGDVIGDTSVPPDDVGTGHRLDHRVHAVEHDHKRHHVEQQHRPPQRPLAEGPDKAGRGDDRGGQHREWQHRGEAEVVDPSEVDPAGAHGPQRHRREREQGGPGGGQHPDPLDPLDPLELPGLRGTVVQPDPERWRVLVGTRPGAFQRAFQRPHPVRRHGRLLTRRLHHPAAPTSHGSA